MHREVQRQLHVLPEAAQAKVQELLQRTGRILTQRPAHEGQEQAVRPARARGGCTSKGKARTPYEFGVKVSIATTLKEGLVVGMRCMPAGLGYKPIQQGGWCRVSVWPTHIDRRRRS